MTKFFIDAEVSGNTPIADGVFRMRFFSKEIAENAFPGQFINVSPKDSHDVFLRRPFGIASVTENEISFIYRRLGVGTEALSRLKGGDMLSVVGPLGHGFTLDEGKTLLVGGGTGLAPLLFLSERLVNADVLMGAKTGRELFWKKLFRKAKNIFETTDDGSVGTKGTVMALLPTLCEKTSYTRIFVCGPSPMMQAVRDFALMKGIEVEVSLERYMACGLGACLSCACDSSQGRVKVCKNGPVFNGREIERC